MAVKNVITGDPDLSRTVALICAEYEIEGDIGFEKATAVYGLAFCRQRELMLMSQLMAATQHEATASGITLADALFKTTRKGIYKPVMDEVIRSQKQGRLLEIRLAELLKKSRTTT